MIEFMKMYFVALIIFFAVDMLWLVFVARGFYAKHLDFIMADKVKWVAAILFYLLFIGGVVFFVISPAIEKQSLMYAIFAGMLFGFMTYATYDLTNLATLKDWPLIVTVVDMVWGTALGGIVSTITYLILR